MVTYIDMPKLESPFVRVQQGKRYVVTPQVADGFEWVFADDAVVATEKLDGTNVSIVIENGHIVRVFNRTSQIDPWGPRSEISDAVRDAVARGRALLPDGQWFGEVIGPKVQGNPYSLEEHQWVPFRTYCLHSLAYRTWGKYPKTFNAISEWFKDGLWSLLYMKHFGGAHRLAEGVVFHHPDGRMAKLRRDMFDWYTGRDHKEGLA